MTHTMSRLAYGLLAISSILLGIWAANNTIALRNILLVLGALLSLTYLYQELIASRLISQLRKIDLLPIACIGTMFLWVLIHFWFISSETALQWQEIKSTWLRSFMAVLIGLATGLGLHHMKRLLPFLWLGAMLSFVYLIIQYIPKAQELNSIFAVDWNGYYIFNGKINSVLMGSILVAGLVGSWIDQFRWSDNHTKTGISLYCLFGIALVLYSYVFLFDTRNGVGVAFVLIAAWIIFAVFSNLLRIFRGGSIRISKTLLVPIVLVIGGMFWFGSQQIERNSGWGTMAEDAYIASQVDNYPNWQDTNAYGLPKTDSGRTVAMNTYQRVSWGIIGMGLVPKQPWGNGVLTGAFSRALKKTYPNAMPISTHSAWIEIALAYGLPGIILTAGSLVLILVLTISSPTNNFDASVYSLSFVLLFLYSIGELSTQHGIEVLFYLIALLAALRLPVPNLNILQKPAQS